jgi:hypothetical protein
MVKFEAQILKQRPLGKATREAGTTHEQHKERMTKEGEFGKVEFPFIQ